MIINIIRLLIFCSILSLISACEKPIATVSDTEQASSSNHSVQLGSTNTPPGWLTHIADQQGYFKQQGLNVVITRYKSGKRALNGLFNNEVNIATTAIGPIVTNSFIRKDFSILATIGTSSNDNLIVARRDRGIQTPADLRARSIATQSASASHFYLHLFLLKHNMTESDIQQSFLKVEKLPEALINGNIDAVSTREPYLSRAADKLGENAVVFETPGLYLKSFQLVAANSYIENNPEVIEKFLKAILLAEQFVKQHRVNAIEILTERFKLSKESVNAIFKYLDLRVALDQSLILKLEDEARWYSQNQSANSKIPNYLNFIHTNALQKVNSNVMTIIK